MTVQFLLPDGSRISFGEVNRKNYKGPIVPGSKIHESSSEFMTITHQEFEHSLFSISHRIFEYFEKIKFSVKEHTGLRLEALLEGELTISENENTVRLTAGHYHLTDVPLFTTLFKRPSSCNIFITHYSTELLEQLGIKVVPSSPTKMPDEMSKLIRELLHNPYEERLRNFYYENSVRELLFFHLAQSQTAVPAELENRDIAKIYQADAIIASNFNEHFTIAKLSRMTGTNEFKLKKGFRQIFGMGVFHRLLFRRMAQAKMLLETTHKSIGEIAAIAGYDTAAGFIHAFRREFKITPREWRNKQSYGEDENYN
jgi:AraC-like DNA-binding protein